MLIAHVSDLHIGRNGAADRAARRVAAAVEDAGAAAVIVTGDITHSGRREELAGFNASFGRLMARERVIAVPGNHDRISDSAGSALMQGGRVAVSSRPGLHVVRVDSTGPHNRRRVSSHGLLTHADLRAVDSALSAAPEGALTVLALHHHLLPLPADNLYEGLSTLLGWPNAAELPLGTELLARARGRCDLVLHGHRHVPAELVLDKDTDRPLRILNAGATGELGRFRVLSARGNRVGAGDWVDVDGDGSMPVAGALVGPATAA
jgi:3',5'-cyclic AMP phosphodiesterase CpdA